MLHQVTGIRINMSAFGHEDAAYWRHNSLLQCNEVLVFTSIYLYLRLSQA
jgi:hypothetical protein